MSCAVPVAVVHVYRPRTAEHTVLYRIVQTHLATFLQTTTAADARGLPAFVEREFRAFLTCGVWRHGFARFRCDACHAERIVPFSCEARAVCPSCGGRRMAERAAHLVEHVLPPVPIRQWVLSLPYRLRYLCAWDHHLCRAVLRIYARALLGRRAGAPVLRVGRDPNAPWVTARGPRHAHLAGVDLHADRAIHAEDRIGLEHLCRYLVRPPLAQERIEILPDGRVGVTLAHPWSDGTRALVFAPLQFLEKLAAVIPRPRINLILYHGILAAHARGRAGAVADGVRGETPAPAPDVSRPGPPEIGPTTSPARRHVAWADRLRFLATIEDPVVVRRILRHVGLPTDSPVPMPARPPPREHSPTFDFPG